MLWLICSRPAVPDLTAWILIARFIAAWAAASVMSTMSRHLLDASVCCLNRSIQEQCSVAAGLGDLAFHSTTKGLSPNCFALGHVALLLTSSFRQGLIPVEDAFEPDE